jgi:hypothetical protein
MALIYPSKPTVPSSCGSEANAENLLVPLRLGSEMETELRADAIGDEQMAGHEPTPAISTLAQPPSPRLPFAILSPTTKQQILANDRKILNVSTSQHVCNSLPLIHADGTDGALTQRESTLGEALGMNRKSYSFSTAPILPSTQAIGRVSKSRYSLPMRRRRPNRAKESVKLRKDVLVQSISIQCPSNM